jgi:radical SAM enzyme (TIGR01210 family)
MHTYPPRGIDRDRFILDRRPPHLRPDPRRHQGLIVEDERSAEGGAVRTATVLLTGRECPWRCVMCDLWQYTIAGDTPRGAIPAQVAAARDELRARRETVDQLKLYNAASFFDPRAVPEEDYDGVAGQLAGLSGVIVESHPALIGPRVDRLLDALDRRAATDGPAPRLEVAMGLETAHPEALDRINKRMTVDSFAAAAGRLRGRGAALRVFLLVLPPFVPASEQDAWLLRSIDAAFACGASVVSLIPTRRGNGALDALAAEGAFAEPRLDDLERSLEQAIANSGHRGRIFADLWDLQRFSRCRACLAGRRARLHTMNLEQRVLARIACDRCGAAV